METKEEILSFLKKNYTYIKEHFHLSKLGLFGSFARDEATQNSDVDIIVQIQENTEDLYEVKTALREYLSNSFQRKVDIANLKYLKPYAKQSILKDVIYV